MNVKELGTGKRNILVVEDMEADNRVLLDILKEHYTVIPLREWFIRRILAWWKVIFLPRLRERTILTA